MPMPSFKHARPLHEAGYSFRAELLKALRRLLYGADTIEMRLREELVCIAYHLLFHCLGKEIARRKRKGTRLYCGTRDAGTGMALAHAGMTGEALGTHYLGTDDAVTDIRLSAETLYAGRIGTENTNVMEHGSLLKKYFIKIQLRMTGRYVQRAVGHSTAVAHENVTQPVIRRVILVYYSCIVHNL